MSASLPAPTTTSRPWMWTRLALLAAGAGAAWAFARFDALPPIPLCLFRILTGRPCPGCGMTRAMVRLADGDVLGSLRMHPLGVVLAGLAAAAAVGTVAGLARGDDPVRDFLDRRGKRLAAGLLVAFVGLWLVRAFVVPSWAPDRVRPFLADAAGSGR